MTIPVSITIFQKENNFYSVALGFDNMVIFKESPMVPLYQRRVQMRFVLLPAAYVGLLESLHT